MLRSHPGLLSLSVLCDSLHCRIWLPLSMPPTSSVFAQARPPQRVQTPIMGPIPLKRVIASQIKNSVDSMQIRCLGSRGLYPAVYRPKQRSRYRKNLTKTVVAAAEWYTRRRNHIYRTTPRGNPPPFPSDHQVEYHLHYSSPQNLRKSGDLWGFSTQDNQPVRSLTIRPA